MGKQCETLNGSILDLDECATLNGGCNHDCINLVGSYVCACINGYMLGEDSRSCQGMPHPRMEQKCLPYQNVQMLCNISLDILECSNPEQICNHTCVELPGSFRCECNAGFTIAADGHSCMGEHESLAI